MIDKKYQIFISSTFTDLKDERDSIIKAILEMYHIPIGMEMFSAEDEDQWEIIRRTIDMSDYYILILGLRYGSETSKGISFTQKEYEYALKKKIPILAFILNENASLPRDKRDDNLNKINKFRETVLKNSKMCSFWANKDELTTKVSISLNKQMNQKPGIGWIRGNQAVTAELSEELTILSKENRELRETVKNLESKINLKIPKIELIIDNILVDKKFNEFEKLTLPEKVDINNIEEHFKEYITKEQICEYSNIHPNQTEIDKYNREYERYYKIKNYSSKLILKVCNTGTTKAKNLFIDIKFPKEILIFNEDIENTEPKNPIPISPINLAQTQSEIKKTDKDYYFSNIKKFGSRIEYKVPKIIPLNQGWFSNLEGNKLTIEINELLHTRTITIEDDYLIVPLAVGKYNIELSIICEEFEIEDKQTIELEVKEIVSKFT